MNDFASVFVLIICLSGPLFLLVSIALVYALIVQNTKHKLSIMSENKKIADERNIISHDRELAIAEMQAERERLDAQKQQDTEYVSALKSSISTLKENSLIEFRSAWFNEISSAFYISELEVEIKFVYLFMRFLGYGINELKVRVPVESQFGRQKVTGIADWVAYSRRTMKPFLVIEVKEQNQKLENAAQEQARSYSFALNAPLYMLTNGKEITIFERTIDDDICLMNVKVSDFPSKWNIIQASIGQKD